MSKKVRIHIFVRGRVQGVFFRNGARRMAQELGLLGWARNTFDGKVELVIEGEKEKIEKMIGWLKVGPPGAKVSGVDVEFEEYKDEFKNFEIRHD